MKTVQILLSDTHFGIKNNSLQWLESQMKFFKEQVIPTAMKLRSKYDKVTLVHCGDLFDSKSSLNTFVWKAVEKLFCEDICRIFDEAFIIAGNHDCYSNTEQEYNINSLDTLKGRNEKLLIIDNDYYVFERCGKKIAFMPWFEFHNIGKLKETVECKPDLIFTHTDLEHLAGEIRELTKGIAVVSGHIHYPFDLNGNVCLGSCYAQTFADANSERGMWVTEDWDIASKVFVPNNSSMKFWRIYNDEILSSDSEIRESDNIEIYIDKDLLKQEEYAVKISEINKKYSKPKVIPVEKTVEITESKSVSSELFDLKSLIQNEIPENLKEKFQKVVEKYNLKQN